MKLLRCSLNQPHRRHGGGGVRPFSDTTASGIIIKSIRDRGLDHAVAREKNLKPLLNIKNLIKSEPSKSLPITIITQQKETLNIPTRPIEFIRKYPSVFQEFLPGGIGIHPHVKLTDKVLNLDAEEQLVYASECYKKDLADRVLKLLMICRVHRIPLKVVDLLKWDMGLPHDFVKSLVPEFPDYFRVVDGKENGELELVCWSNEHAVSCLERKVGRTEEVGCLNGKAIAFPMKFSKGFEFDKKAKKWVDEWQKLPYISPFENAMHLSPSTDESDKWAAAVLHEVLNTFVAKKAERDNVLSLGEYLGLRSRFKRALLHHPGIFYLSGKIGTYTVVLKEAYKRGMLVESNPLVKIRSQYVNLMHTVEEERKAVSVPGVRKQKDEGKVKEEVYDGDEEDENDKDVDALSDSEAEDDHEDGGEEGQNQRGRGVRKNGVVTGGRGSQRKSLDVRGRRTNRYADGVRGSRNRRDRSSREWSTSTRGKVRLLTEKRTKI